MPVEHGQSVKHLTAGITRVSFHIWVLVTNMLCHLIKPVIKVKGKTIIICVENGYGIYIIDHNTLTSIVSFNLPFCPPQELCTIGFIDLCSLLFHKVLVLSLTEKEEQCLQDIFIMKVVGLLTPTFDTVTWPFLKINMGPGNTRIKISRVFAKIDMGPF